MQKTPAVTTTAPAPPRPFQALARGLPEDRVRKLVSRHPPEMTGHIRSSMRLGQAQRHDGTASFGTGGACWLRFVEVGELQRPAVEGREGAQ